MQRSRARCSRQSSQRCVLAQQTLSKHNLREMKDGFSIEFAPRVVALEPSCVVGVGRVADALFERLLRETDATLRNLRGICYETASHGRALVVIGSSEDLPWVDGVAYLGIQSGAGKLRLPTTLQPNVPVDALERAVLRHHSGDAPVAVIAEPMLLLSLANATVLTLEQLAAWRSRSS